MKRKFLFIPLVCICLAFSFSARAADEETAYAKAKSCYGELKVTPKKAADRSEWGRCIGLFEKVSDKYPGSVRGKEALFSAGRLNQEMYGKFKKTEDAEAAIKLFNQFFRDNPKNELSDDALMAIGRLRRDAFKDNEKAKKAFSYILETYPDGDMAESAKKELDVLGKKAPLKESSEEEKVTPPAKEEIKPEPKEAAPSKTSKFDETGMAGPNDTAFLKSIDVVKGQAETTVELKLTKKAAYSVTYTEPGPHTKSPPNLDMLVSYTRADSALAREYVVNSQYLSKIKIKKDLLKGGVKLFFEMGKGSQYTIAAKGSNIVLKFSPQGARKDKTLDKKVDGKKGSVAQAERSENFTVVIDPGHGGDDTGAIGPKGLEEKDVALALSKQIAAQLKKDADLKVYLTRSTDKNLTLEERDAFAVSKKADLFISVHANASKDKKSSGIETYFLNNATDEAAAKLARRENKAAKKKLSDVEHILSTMMQNYDAAESKDLAGEVQKSLVGKVSKHYNGVKNRKVRSALFYVLVGAKCPAILVESSFISNPKEARRLTDRQYQNDIATGVVNGIKKYIKESDKKLVSL